MLLAHSLLSGVLLLLPIAITVGVYIGIEFQKIFHSGFEGTYGVLDPGFAGGPSNSDGIRTTRYCQKTIGVTPKGGRYTYNPNQWALGANDASRACMNVTTGTLTNGSVLADPWAVTWNYTVGPETQPVHAFPNALLDVSLPNQLSNMSAIQIDVSWTYAVGSVNGTSTASADLAAADMNANVAFDMFIDPSKAGSQVTSSAKYEVMVWLGMFGAATQPIGLDVGPVDNVSVNGTAFALYSGTNAAGQKVFTWLASVTTNHFVGDIYPMLTKLSGQDGGPASSAYLGYVAFGSEAYSSPNNVTLSVPELSIDIQ